jgi:hypothetical protein
MNRFYIDIFQYSSANFQNENCLAIIGLPDKKIDPGRVKL